MNFIYKYDKAIKKVNRNSNNSNKWKQIEKVMR